VNFGSAFVGVAAGAVPPPPLSSVVVVVSVEVVSLDVVSVAVELDVESGVVVVIVVTTVELPVVIVVTIVVVASAWNGAAPAVNAAVAAPSVISTANAAPQTAYFLYCLLIPPPCFLDYKEAYPPGKYLFHPVSDAACILRECLRPTRIACTPQCARHVTTRRRSHWPPQAFSSL
jgi:hypothetical protein